MLDGRTDIKKPFLAGMTRQITFQIVENATGIGFQPGTLTMSIYDVNPSGNGVLDSVYLVSGKKTGQTVASAIVNARDDVDVSAFCDSSGTVELFLTPDDTDLEVPAIIVNTPFQRHVLFRWTWDSPVKTGKHEIILRIQPDRESVAS